MLHQTQHDMLVTPTHDETMRQDIVVPGLCIGLGRCAYLDIVSHFAYLGSEFCLTTKGTKITK